MKIYSNIWGQVVIDLLGNVEFHIYDGHDLKLQFNPLAAEKLRDTLNQFLETNEKLREVKNLLGELRLWDKEERD